MTTNTTPTANVVSLRKPRRTAAEIKAARDAERLVAERQITARLKALNQQLDQRVADCRAEAAELGRIMAVQDLYDWLKIGRELCGRTTGLGGDL